MGEEGDANPSRARDHLANERTYLAWLRTAANVMVLGLAIAKFASGGVFTEFAAGGILVLVGALGLLYGTVRYRRVNSEIENGCYTTGSRGRGPALATAVLIVAVFASLGLLLVGKGQGG